MQRPVRFVSQFYSSTRAKTCAYFTYLCFYPHLNICQTRTMISSATLNLEPRRLSLLIPGLYALDIDLNPSTASLYHR
ncbi:hypothetical protein BGW80DRAFT_1286203 [Lactifluus volemus]|nr:hypothetical protein BGW80DRAFT_1286203 [Lactifluus volemus]